MYTQARVDRLESILAEIRENETITAGGPAPEIAREIIRQADQYNRTYWFFYELNKLSRGEK